MQLRGGQEQTALVGDEVCVEVHSTVGKCMRVLRACGRLTICTVQQVTEGFKQYATYIPLYSTYMMCSTYTCH